MMIPHTMMLHRARWQVAALRVRTDLLRLRLLRAYDPDQPRVPGGSREGGRWTNGDIHDRESTLNDGPVVRISDAQDHRYTVAL